MKLTECQLDSYQTDLEIEIVSCHASDEGFLVQTDRSIAFEGGGGQPPDVVFINDTEVSPVADREAALPGFRSPIEMSVGPGCMRIDWHRRFDHMQQHTAQHILTAVAEREFGWSTLSFHLNPDRSDVVLDTSPPDDAALRRLETRVNAIIREARPVIKRDMDRDEVVAGGARYRRLPPEEVKNLRMIEVEGIDLNPCGGTHVRSTSELQYVRLLRANAEKGGRCRLHFLAGERALAHGLRLQQHEAALRGLLSCPVEEQADAIRGLLEREKQGERRARELEIEVAEFAARRLAECPEQVMAERRIAAGPDFVNTVARVVSTACPDKVVLIVTGEAPHGVFTLLGPPEMVEALAPLVCDALEGRGGGRGRRYQGKAKQPDAIQVALQTMRVSLGG